MRRFFLAFLLCAAALSAGAQVINNPGAGGSGGITIGTTAITGGTANQILYDNAGAVGEIIKCNSGVYQTNGSGVPSCGTTLPSGVGYQAPTIGSTPINSGATVTTIAGLTLTSPTFTNPALGTPASGVATNLTGTAAGLTAGNVTTNANLTGPVTSVGNATSFSTMTANAFLTGNGTSLPNQVAITGLVLGAGANAPGAYGGTSCTNQFPRSLNASGAATCATVGSGDLAASLSLTTPNLNVATATTVNKWTFTAPTTSATLTAGADNVVYTGPAASKTLAANDLSNVTMSQDCTNSNAVITCLKTNNVAFTAVATAAAGQLTATATNDNASAGKLGEYVSETTNNSSATVTFTNGSANIGWTAHGMSAGSVVNFTTSGSLPTNFSTATNYYVIATGLSANNIQVSATPGGAAISAGSAGSGTQTGNEAALLTSSSAINTGTLSLTAGDWMVCGEAGYGAASTSATSYNGGFNLTTAASPTINDTITAGTGPGYLFNTAAITLAERFTIPCGRVSLASTTTVYMVAISTFTGTESGFGFMSARRMR